MAKDLREQVVNKFMNMLVQNDFDTESLSSIKSLLIVALENVEIIERSTELTIVDNSVDKILKLYASCLLSEGKSPRTVKSYLSVLKRFYSDNNKNIDEINAYDIRLWLAKMQQKVKLTTCVNYRAYLLAFYEWLEFEEIIKNNPMKKVKPITCDTTIKSAFTDIEIEKMRMSCRNVKQRACFELLLSSGVRLNELIMMNIEDVDFTSLKIIVKHGKGNKQRETYMSPICALYLKAYLETRNDNCEALLATKNNQRYSSRAIEMLIESIGKLANVYAHPHKFRRTCASNLIKNGMDIRTVQILLGHSNINTTMKYISLDSQYIKHEYDKYMK